MGNSPPVTPPKEPAKERLDSWKEIAAYLNRDITTVQRWEKREGMPVHRHLHDKRGSVYALGSELDEWVRGRRPQLEESEKEPHAEDPEKAQPVQPPAQPLSQKTRRWIAAASIAVVVVLGAAYVIMRTRLVVATQPKIKSLAVLPLKNLSGDPGKEYLADGMTEALIGRLAQIHELRVISHTSVTRFKNSQLSIPEIAKTLGVDAVVEGSVTPEGDRIRVTAQLIRGATEGHFWSETYDRRLQDALTLQSELAQSIAERVQVTVTGAEERKLTTARSITPDVYENYLKGRYALNKANSREEIEASIGYFEEATKKDPTFAPAYFGTAEAYNLLGTVFIGVRPEQTRPKVLSAARKALELEPDLSEAHLLVGAVAQQQWRWSEAEAEFRIALDSNPNNAAAHQALAGWLGCQGRPDEALAQAKLARELDPITFSGLDIGWILFQARRNGEAESELRSLLAVQPEDGMALWFLGFVLIADNQAAAAIPVLEKALSVSHRSPGVEGVLIRAYAHAGRREDALRLLSVLNSGRKSGYVPTAAFVNAYLGLDDKEQAFAWLEKAYSEQSNILQFLKVLPYFDPLRGDPRFADLQRRVGLD